MGLYREHILPRVVDRACGGAELQQWRAKVTEGLTGTLVEIGFGSGLNVPVYPPEVNEVYAVEPANTARRLAEGRIADSDVIVHHVGLRGEEIPLDDDSCDGALSTFTLCTIPGVEQALAEVRRVLRPDGRFHFLEHGRSPDEPVLRWQRRLEPIQKVVADGCHLTRDPAELVEAAGFDIERVETRYGRGPKPYAWFTEGAAVNPA
jgi:ubiquinone/menaquinone biosynthesis C-methylase UbiE